MKKIGTLILWLLATWTAYAQPATTFSGNFSDPSNVPAIGIILNISIFGSGGFYLDDTTYTDSSGDYLFSYNLPQGNYNGYISYQDCDGTSVIDTFFLTAPNNLPKDFIYCPNGTGGVNCDATFSAFLDTNQTAYTYNFFPVGQNSSTTSYLWSFGDGTTSTDKFPTHTYATAPAYYPACLTVYDSATMCEDSTCGIVVIAGGPGSCSGAFTYSNNNGVVSFNSSTTGPSPFTYAWDFGDGNVSALADPVHTYATGGTYLVTLIITANTGCTDTITSNVNVQILLPGDAKVKGIVFNYDSTGTINTGEAYLIEYDTVGGGTLTAIDTVDIVQGYFEFEDVFPGTYLVKAAAAPSAPGYADNLPTYYYSSVNWSSATDVLVNLQDVWASIIMQQGTNPGGPGFIGGLVSLGANKNAGDPLEDIQVNLFTDAGEAVAYQYTDIDGKYAFDDLAYGTYRVYVEIPGVNAQEFTVVLNATSEEINGIDFEVNETGVNIVTSNEPTVWQSSLELFPNPVGQELNIKLEALQSEEVTFTLWSATGQAIFQRSEVLATGLNRIVIPTKDLTSGIYMMEVKVGERVQVTKFVKK
ncbi:MAG: PKD domain-containing protein [Bacteroidota bacterium]